MDPLVESALISAAATLVGVGGTVAVAIVGFTTSRSTNQATIDAARKTNKATIDAAHADVQRTVGTTREGQIADIYCRSVEQLGSDKLDVRIGGVYGLERVARASAPDHPTVMEVLTAFIREHSREQWPEPEPGGPAQERSMRPDVRAAITVVGRRDPKRDVGSLDLTRAFLADVNLSGVDLTDANFDRANLTGADLGGANLTGADLAGGANLDSADLTDANLTGARLAGADLTGTFLDGANLTRADLTGASWPHDERVPPGWKRNASSGQLEAAETGVETAEA